MVAWSDRDEYRWNWLHYYSTYSTYFDCLQNVKLRQSVAGWVWIHRENHPALVEVTLDSTPN